MNAPHRHQVHPFKEGGSIESCKPCLTNHYITQSYPLPLGDHQSVNSVQSYPTLCDTMDCSMPGFLAHHQLPELAQTHVHQFGDAIQPFPLSSPSPTFNLSQHQFFSSESVLHIRWPKYCSFGFSISPSNEYSGLISSRIDWFDLLSVQGTLKSLLQNHSSKASILQHSAFSL